MKVYDIIAEKASYALCTSGRADKDLGASNLASCRSQGLRAREGNKSHLIGHGDSAVRVTVGGKKIKGKKYGGPLPDYGTRKSQKESVIAEKTQLDTALDVLDQMTSQFKGTGKLGGFNFDTGPDDAPSGTQPSGTSSTGAESSGKVVIVGDSLAVGTATQVPGAIKDAVVGINSAKILDNVRRNKDLKGADVAIISAGANDGAGAEGKNPRSDWTIGNLKGIRSELKAKKYIWILPYNRSVAKDVQTAAESGDQFIDLADTVKAGKDKVHPVSYGPVAKAAITKGHIEPAKPGGGSGKPGDPKGKFKDNRSFRVDPGTVKSYLLSKGLDKNQTAGWLANIKAECGFYPGRYVWDVNAPGGGVFGFHTLSQEFPKMVKFAGDNWQTNWQGQLDYALQTPQGQQYKSMRFPSPGAAAEWWTLNYERPRDMTRMASIRARDANNFA